MSVARRFRALIMGPPGSGKGHISKKICSLYGAIHIAAGDILRQHIQKRTKLGREAVQYTSTGRLVPDRLLRDIMEAAIEKADDRNFILDGYPRTLPQAKHLDSLVDLDFVINLEIPDEAIVEMLKARLVHVPSGRVYNENTNAPRKAGLDDETGEALQRRADDNPVVVAKRLRSYLKESWPVLQHYKNRFKVYTVQGRSHIILWPKVRKYMNRRLHKCPELKFKPRKNTDLMQCTGSKHSCEW